MNVNQVNKREESVSRNFSANVLEAAKAVINTPLATDEATLKAQVMSMFGLLENFPELATVFGDLAEKHKAEDIEAMSMAEILALAVQVQEGLKKITENEFVIAADEPKDDFTTESNNINFDKFIAGPLIAATDAQAQASFNVIDHCRKIGFEADGDNPTGKVRYVDFVYEEKTGKVDPNTGTEITIKKDIKVPLLSMVQIPTLRIETLDIDFNVKLNSVRSKDVSSDFKVDLSGKAGWGPISMKVSGAYQRTSTQGVRVQKQYTMNVKVKATQDEIPAGLEKILNLLSD